MQELLQNPSGLLLGKGQRGQNLFATTTGTPWSSSPPSSAAPPHPPSSVSHSHCHPQRAKLDTGTGGRLHRESEGGSLPALAGVWQCHRRHPLLPWCVVRGNRGWLPGGGTGPGQPGPISQGNAGKHIPVLVLGTPGMHKLTVPKPIGVSSQTEPSTSLTVDIPLLCSLCPPPFSPPAFPQQPPHGEPPTRLTSMMCADGPGKEVLSWGGGGVSLCQPFLARSSQLPSLFISHMVNIHKWAQYCGQGHSSCSTQLPSSREGKVEWEDKSLDTDQTWRALPHLACWHSVPANIPIQMGKQLAQKL